MFFAFLTSPFPSHLGQMSLAVRELLRRGHRAEIWGDDSSEQIARELGAAFELVPLTRDLIDGVTRYSQRPQDYYSHFAFPLTVQQLPQVLELCEKRSPDMIHSNSRIYTAAIATRLTGIPCSNHCCSGLSFGLIPEDLFGFHLTGDEPPRRRDLMIAMNRSFHRQIDSLFERIVARPLSLEPIQNVLGMISDECVLSLSCLQLANPRLAALPQTVFTGPLIAETASAACLEGDYCYVSLGTWPLDMDTTINLYRTIIAGIPREYRVIVGLGGRCEPRELAVKDDRVLVLKYAPQSSLVRSALAVVCHGGCQTVHEALYFGKPLVMLPPGLAEPQDLSHKVARWGAGVVLDYRNATSDDIRRTVSEVIRGQAFGRCAEHLGRSLRSSGGLDRAVESFERLVAKALRRPPRQTFEQPSHSAGEAP